MRVSTKHARRIYTCVSHSNMHNCNCQSLNFHHMHACHIQTWTTHAYMRVTFKHARRIHTCRIFCYNHTCRCLGWMNTDGAYIHAGAWDGWILMAHWHTYMNTYMHEYIHAHFICVCVYTICVCVCVHTHTDTHTHTHAHMRTHARAHTHTHTHRLTFALSFRIWPLIKFPNDKAPILTRTSRVTWYVCVFDIYIHAYIHAYTYMHNLMCVW
jgi:hypothetical protein